MKSIAVIGSEKLKVVMWFVARRRDGDDSTLVECDALNGI